MSTRELGGTQKMLEDRIQIQNNRGEEEPHKEGVKWKLGENGGTVENYKLEKSKRDKFKVLYLGSKTCKCLH